MFGTGKRLRRLARRIDGVKAEIAQLHELQCLEYRDRLMRLPRYSEDLRLLKSGYRVYSQNDEDGIIEEIFRRVGTVNRFCVEFGAAGGFQSNTLNLIVAGWRGLWMERNGDAVEQIRARFRVFIEEEKRLHLEQVIVTPDNINDVLSRLVPCDEPDLLSIDIDGNDYWVWQAVSARRPRIVVIEYNALWQPPASVTIPYDVSRVWDWTSYFGASLKALEKLGASKGYKLVGCCFAGVNAFFVREDLCGQSFLAPFTAENHYEPLRLFMVGKPSGYPPGIGPLVIV